MIEILIFEVFHMRLVGIFSISMKLVFSHLWGLYLLILHTHLQSLDPVVNIALLLMNLATLNVNSLLLN